MNKCAILEVERRLQTRLVGERRFLNLTRLAGGARTSKRATKGKTKGADPWYDNRTLYEKEKTYVKAKKTKTMGYGLFAHNKKFKKGEVVIRMVEPISTPVHFNNMARNRVPWTKHGGDKSSFAVRKDGNGRCNLKSCKTCCVVVINHTPYETKFGKVRGTVRVKDKKRCRDLDEQYVDDDLFTLRKDRSCTVPLPNDAGIRDGDGRTVIYDNAFVDMNHIPLWYRINHSCRPNLEIRTTGRGGSGVKFVATRNIRDGEQLFFNYGLTPSAWNHGC
jgi:hypothetical protein